MPDDRNSQAHSVQRRVVRSHPLPSSPEASAPTPNANGTAKPVRPRYSTSGWIIITGCWSSGFRPAPSESTSPGGSFSKGLVTNTSSTRKKAPLPSRVAEAQGSRFVWRRFTSMAAAP
jgi:hypothetical protein